MSFLDSFKPLWEVFKKYKIEVSILFVAGVIALLSTFILLKENQAEGDEVVFVPDKTSSKLYVEISGSVKKPGVYSFGQNSRLKDVLEKSQGLAEEADKSFFDRNFNLARKLSDQEKIYIPSVRDIETGLYSENVRTLDYKTSVTGAPETTWVNINNADFEELDSLPGVGKVTAQKIIDARPYESTEDLLIKKIVGKGLYEKIKDQIKID